jgi:hypothetical protein
MGERSRQRHYPLGTDGVGWRLWHTGHRWPGSSATDFRVAGQSEVPTRFLRFSHCPIRDAGHTNKCIGEATRFLPRPPSGPTVHARDVGTLVVQGDNLQAGGQTANPENAPDQRGHNGEPTSNNPHNNPPHDAPVDTTASYFRGQDLWIADFARRSTVVSDKVFEDCQIFGPAVVAAFNSGTFVDCTWAEGENPKSVLWEATPDREKFVGVIGLEDCLFRRCHFVRVGLLVKPEEYRTLIEDSTD